MLWRAESNTAISVHLFAGPFVMNTEEEIKETFKDYRLGKNGFEKAPTWSSTSY